MKHVLTYELAEGAQALAMEHYPAHRARLDEFRDRGVLLLVGTFADEPVGAMAVFTTRHAVEEFMAEDPFLRHGVVGRHRVREWDEVMQP
ncbi:YciI family protein [Pseudonocardia saturnea]